MNLVPSDDRNPHLFDSVRFAREVEGFVAGTGGAVVEEYDGKAYLVALFDDHGATLDVVAAAADDLEIVERHTP